MKRKKFIKTILGTSILMTMDGFSTIASAMSNSNKEHESIEQFASIDSIHLNVTNLNKTTNFWTDIVGMKLRKTSTNSAEFGTDTKTLVVVHQVVKTHFKKGYSGLYHIAIHAPNKSAFASMLNRLIAKRYPYSPVDHTMSKSIYLDDPDGINIEFTLETPERFKRVITQGGFKMEDTDGTIRGVSEYLDVRSVLKDLKDDDVNKPINNGTYLVHIHIYANNVDESNKFYRKLGFLQFNNFPQFMYADLGSGGAYKHRIALNSWHGVNKPLAPKDSAGMQHFQINFKDKEKLKLALKSIPDFEEKNGGYWFNDPTGNKIFLKNN